MPKYIKDGAYTIVVDERAPSPKRTATPKTFDGSDTEGDELGNSDTEGEGDDGIHFGGDDEGEEDEEEIDYADPAFILQNLSISTPNFSADTTRLLPGREELAGVICSQVRYYCYCAIDSFARNPRPVTILVIGEGFVGSRVINDLIRNGSKEMLRVCTRGDLTAEEWRARGIKADNNIITLLDGEQPDIVIITVENASFTAVCKQLITNYVITESTFVISTTFGFQRRKLYTQLHTPHIFRTFIEPEEIFNAYKKKAFTSLLAFTKAPDINTLPEINHMPSSDSISTRDERLPNVPEEGLFSPVDASRPQSRAATKDEEAASMYMAKRYGDTRNLVYQLENYYAVRHHGFAEARHKALKNVYGILIDDHGIETPIIAAPTHRRSSTDEAIEQMSIKKAMKIESRLLAKVENALNKMSFYHQCVPTYRAHFVSLLSSHDLHELKAKKYTREQNNPKSGPNMGFERHRNAPKNAPPPPANAKTIADLPGRAMYDKAFLEELLRKDEDYGHFVGPGFDLMTAWDRKIENRGSGLKLLQQMSASTEPNSPASAALRAQGLHRPSQSQSHSHSGSHSHSAHNTPHGHEHAHGHGHHAHPDLRPEHRQMSQEEIELEAQRELHEYGRRLSNLADHEASSIDHNYMQQYLDSSSRKF